MRKTYRTVPILTGNELPGKGRRGPAQFKGQLYLEHSSGTYYRATEAGPEESSSDSFYPGSYHDR